MTSFRLYLITLAAFLPFALLASEDSLLISLNHSIVSDVGKYYSHLTGKTVLYSNGNLEPLPIKIESFPITITTCGARLQKAQAIRFLESALYLKGIKVVAKSDTTVVFTRYANIIDPEIGAAINKRNHAK
jgi:hypothetical protein